MLVIKKRSKLVQSLMAGVVMFAVGLTGSVAYLDATTPSGFVSGKDPSPLTKTSGTASEAVANQTATGETSTDATSSSSDQPDTVAAIAPASAESHAPITAPASNTVAERSASTLESAPSTSTPTQGDAPDQEPSLIESVIQLLLP